MTVVSVTKGKTYRQSWTAIGGRQTLASIFSYPWKDHKLALEWPNNVEGDPQ